MATCDYHKGDLPRCRGVFTDESGAGIDPDTVTFKYKNPAGTITTLTYGVDAEVIRESAGRYYVDVNADATGTWYHRFESTGSGQAADEDNFYVAPSKF